MLTALLVLLLIVIALLAIPLVVEFDVTGEHELRGQVRLSWAFGLASGTVARLPASDKSGAASTRQTKQKKPGKKQSAKTGEEESGAGIVRAIRDRDFRRRLLRFGKDSWHAIHKDQLKLHLRLGLDDPADTGLLWAIVGPLSGWLTTLREASVRIEPNFNGASIAVDSSGRISFTPLRLLQLSLGLALAPEFWAGMKKLRGRHP